MNIEKSIQDIPIIMNLPSPGMGLKETAMPIISAIDRFCVRTKQ